MKTLEATTGIIVINFILSLNFTFAQAPPDFSVICREEIKKIAYLAGNWKGEATYQRGPGSSVTVSQEEKVEFKLDGTALLIEGTGRDTDGAVVFNALAVVNYDAIDKNFKFKSYLKDGRSTDAYFNVVGENKFEWGFEIPGGGKTKYTITLDPSQKRWYEKGEFSRDGNTWFSFIELKLNKIEE